MNRNLITGLLVVIGIGGALAAFKYSQFSKMGAAKASFIPPPETVSTAVVREEKWPDTLITVGSVSPAQGVIVSPEIAGTVREIAFESGASVKASDLLVKLDTSSEEAQLDAANARVELAELNAKRTRQLCAEKTVSQSELDQAEATLKEAKANAAAIDAIIGKKTIRAPFAGLLGIRLVNLGELLDVGKGIVSLQSLSPVFVDFSLPQQDLSRLQTGLKVEVTSDTYGDQMIEGEVAAINPDLDTVTRSVRVRARFENRDQLLRAGMFVRVKVVLPEARKVIVIPSTAILRAPFGDSVFVVTTNINHGTTNLVAQKKFVRIGRSRTQGDFISVEAGLAPGERVVTAGIFKLRNDVPIKENNEDTPTPSLSPNPPNS